MHLQLGTSPRPHQLCTAAGGTVVCTDAARIRFINCTFDGCTLVVKGASKMHIHHAVFTDMRMGSGLGLFMTGTDPFRELHACSFNGGIQAANVSAGKLLVWGKFQLIDIDSFAVEASGACTELAFLLDTLNDLQDLTNMNLLCRDGARAVFENLPLKHKFEGGSEIWNQIIWTWCIV